MTDLAGWDTLNWRQRRDAVMLDWLGDAAAVECLVAISTAAEAWDDAYDGDKNADFDAAFAALFVQLPLNPFWQKAQGWLMPLVVACVNAWMDAREMEKGGHESKVRAFMLRNLGLELVPAAVFYLHGYARMRELSMEIRAFFDHERFDDWEREHGK